MTRTAYRRQRPATRPVGLMGTLIAAAAALLLAGCSPVAVSGAPTSTSGTTSQTNTGSAGADATAEDGEDANADGSDGSASGGSDDGCQVTINGPGSIRVNGASNRVVTRNGASSLSCANGSLMAIEGVENGAVSFSIDGGQPVRVATGQTASVGDYSVTVNEADGERAEFVVAP